MIRRAGRWDLAACGAGVGGLAVWGLAAAARAGWLRALLDVYPRSSWDRVTWVLIPVLLLLPPIVQGAAVAALAPRRPVAIGRAVAGSIGGSLLLLVVAGAAALFAARRFPALAGGAAAQVLPIPLVLGCAAALIAGCVGVAAGGRWWRRAAVPLALVAAAIAWVAARESVVSASYVLDRAEITVFFVAVAAGGGLGSAWIICAAEP